MFISYQGREITENEWISPFSKISICLPGEIQDPKEKKGLLSQWRECFPWEAFIVFPFLVLIQVIGEKGTLKKKRKRKTSEEMLKRPIVKHNKPIRKVIYFFQLIGIVIPIFFPLWVTYWIISEVILFVIHEIIDGLHKESVWLCIIELTETCKMLNKRL